MNPATWLPTALVCLLVSGCAVDAKETKPEPETRPAPTSSATSSAPTPEPVAPTTPAPAPAPAPKLPAELQRSLANRPLPATSPRQVVAQIVAAERAIADDKSAPDVLAAAGHLQQVAYRQLGTHPRWDARVRAALPRDLVTAVRDNVASRRAFQSMHPRARSRLSKTLPAWRIVRPAPPQALMASYRAAEKRFGVDWAYLAAINLVETGMGRIRGTSIAGAQGPMQFIPGTWARYGRGDINSPRDSIMAAGRYLKSQGFTRPRGKPRALYRYNNHPAYVRGVTLLARTMQQRPRAFQGYYHWQIYYLTRHGSILLPEGYDAARPIPVRKWLARG